MTPTNDQRKRHSPGRIRRAGRSLLWCLRMVWPFACSRIVLRGRRSIRRPAGPSRCVQLRPALSPIPTNLTVSLDAMSRFAKRFGQHHATRAPAASTRRLRRHSRIHPIVTLTRNAGNRPISDRSLRGSGLAIHLMMRRHDRGKRGRSTSEARCLQMRRRRSAGEGRRRRRCMVATTATMLARTPTGLRSPGRQRGQSKPPMMVQIHPRASSPTRTRNGISRVKEEGIWTICGVTLGFTSDARGCLCWIPMDSGDRVLL